MNHCDSDILILIVYTYFGYLQISWYNFRKQIHDLPTHTRKDKNIARRNEIERQHTNVELKKEDK